MSRAERISDGVISLCEYIGAEDDPSFYECWRDEDTQSGFNHKAAESFEEFQGGAIKSRFIAAVVRLSDNAVIGAIFLSAIGTPPDLAIMIFGKYRGKGYGTRAFSLGAEYCLEAFSLDEIFAGCYPHNIPSLKMLEKCGFLPHPEGNLNEKHYLSGAEITQLDFIRHKKEK